MVQTIYRYGNEFDKNVIYDKMADIDEQIEDEQDQELTKERDKKIRELMYAKFVQGLKLSTGYNHF